MGSASDYRNKAKECLALCRRVHPAGRKALRSVAQAWLELAHAAEAAQPVSPKTRLQKGRKTIH